MSLSKSVQLHQEKVILAVAGIVILAVIATVTYFNVIKQEQEKTKLPDTAALSVKLGSNDAPQKMVVYTDPVCDKCAEYHEETLKQVYDNYVKTDALQLEIRPLSIVTEQSASLTELLMCGNEQNKYWQTTDFVYDALTRKNNQTMQINAATFFIDFPAAEISEIVGLDETQLSSCLDANRYQEKITQADQAAYSVNVYSTPTTFIGDREPIRGMSIYPFVESLIKIEG
ncbi:MAG: hypothetical protein UY35_C0001G0063 [Candidatus Saccharibacteria bacterium GW2011_GWC2_48_9]|nr:MAG: hypothetical protein UY35_C0001G0063 [Candidatus Saccharibacteria bacterium GW2011_GWC2_48_9]HCH33982.1 hypothetical protein [Candidatus Saccharibacteria bacterium]